MSIIIIKCPVCNVSFAREECECIAMDREEDESEREWFKRWMCMYHWMQTDYYRNKLNADTDTNGK